MNKAVQSAEQAWDNFEESYREMILSFDKDALDVALLSWLRSEGFKFVEPDADEDDVQTVLEIGFGILVGRGAITPVRPFSVAGQTQFNALKTIRGTNAAPQETGPVDPLAELLDDNTKLSCADFKAKWLVGDPRRRALYEEACAAGRV